MRETKSQSEIIIDYFDSEEEAQTQNRYYEDCCSYVKVVGVGFDLDAGYFIKYKLKKQ